ARLAEEARLRRRVRGPVAPQDLDRDVTADGVLARFVDRTHRARAELGEDREPTIERAPDHRVAVPARELGGPHRRRLILWTDNGFFVVGPSALGTDCPLRSGGSPLKR